MIKRDELSWDLEGSPFRMIGEQAWTLKCIFILNTLRTEAMDSPSPLAANNTIEQLKVSELEYNLNSNSYRAIAGIQLDD